MKPKKKMKDNYAFWMFERNCAIIMKSKSETFDF